MTPEEKKVIEKKAKKIRKSSMRSRTQRIVNLGHQAHAIYKNARRVLRTTSKAIKSTKNGLAMLSS